MTKMYDTHIYLNPQRQIVVNTKQFAAFTVVHYKETFQLCGILQSGSHVVIDEFTTLESAMQKLDEIAVNLD